MNKYLLFAGELSNPHGGWHDFVGDFDSVEEALENIPATAEWHHIVYDNEIILQE